MPARDTDWTSTQLLDVTPHPSGNVGSIALARQLDSRGLWRLLVILLTPKGEPIGRSDWLPVESPGNGIGLTPVGEREALLYVTERCGGHPRSKPCDAPRWFSVKWREGKIRLLAIGQWDDVRLGLSMKGLRAGRESVWAGLCYAASSPKNHLDTRLVLARSEGLTPPAPVVTEVDCCQCSVPVQFEDEFYTIVSVRYERVELWAFDRNLAPRKILDLAKARKSKRESVGPGMIARIGDSLTLAWGSYLPRVGDKKPGTWQGTIDMVGFCPGDGTVGKVRLLTTDTRVIAASLEIHASNDRAFVTWESRPKRGGGGMRAVEAASLEDLPRDPVALPSKDESVFLPDSRHAFLREYYDPSVSSWGMEGVELD